MQINARRLTRRARSAPRKPRPVALAVDVARELEGPIAVSTARSDPFFQRHVARVQTQQRKRVECRLTLASWPAAGRSMRVSGSQAAAGSDGAYCDFVGAQAGPLFVKTICIGPAIRTCSPGELSPRSSGPDPVGASEMVRCCDRTSAGVDRGACSASTRSSGSVLSNHGARCTDCPGACTQTHLACNAAC